MTTDFKPLDGKPGPIEVWLVQDNMEINTAVYFEDETSASGRGVGTSSLSMRGAQREVTAQILELGYEPAGRWEYPDEAGNEAVRQFRPAKDPE